MAYLMCTFGEREPLIDEETFNSMSLEEQASYLDGYERRNGLCPVEFDF